MVDAAQFRALPVIRALAVDPHPGLVDAPGHGVQLGDQRRNRPGVKHVVRGHQNADVGIDGENHLVVHREEAGLPVLQFVVGHHEAVEGKIPMIGILIGPVPLVADHLDRHFRVLGAVHEVQQLERRNRDDHQDDNRNCRPQHFEHGIVGGLRGHGVAVLVEAQRHIDHQSKNEDRDTSDDDQQEVVKFADSFHHRRRRRLEPEPPGLRRGRQGASRRGARRDQRCKDTQSLDHKSRPN